MNIIKYQVKDRLRFATGFYYLAAFFLFTVRTGVKPIFNMGSKFIIIIIIYIKLKILWVQVTPQGVAVATPLMLPTQSSNYTKSSTIYQSIQTSQQIQQKNKQPTIQLDTTHKQLSSNKRSSIILKTM